MKTCQHTRAHTGTDQTLERKCGAQCDRYPGCQEKIGGFETLPEAAASWLQKHPQSDISIG